MAKDLPTAMSLARKLSPNCDKVVTTKDVVSGLPSEYVSFNQPWMSSNESGQPVDLTLEQKKAIDGSMLPGGSAAYAAAALGTYVGSMPSGMIANNPQLGLIQSYPVGQGTAEVWKTFPQLAPMTYAERQQQALGNGKVNFNTPSGSPGSENEPAHTTGFVVDEAINYGETLGSQSTPGIGSGGAGSPSAASNVIDKLKTTPLILAAVIIGGLVLIFLMGKGLSGGIRA